MHVVYKFWQISDNFSISEKSNLNFFWIFRESSDLQSYSSCCQHKSPTRGPPCFVSFAAVPLCFFWYCFNSKPWILFLPLLSHRLSCIVLVYHIKSQKNKLKFVRSLCNKLWKRQGMWIPSVQDGYVGWARPAWTERSSQTLEERRASPASSLRSSVGSGLCCPSWLMLKSKGTRIKGRNRMNKKWKHRPGGWKQKMRHDTCRKWTGNRDTLSARELDQFCYSPWNQWRQ